jgi:hypothetical protein
MGRIGYNQIPCADARKVFMIWAVYRIVRSVIRIALIVKVL